MKPLVNDDVDPTRARHKVTASGLQIDISAKSRIMIKLRTFYGYYKCGCNKMKFL